MGLTRGRRIEHQPRVVPCPQFGHCAPNLAREESGGLTREEGAEGWQRLSPAREEGWMGKEGELRRGRVQERERARVG